jgi:tetratricopeptide (TPR) repeat protein
MSHRGDYQGAVMELQEALKQNPYVQDVHIDIGDALRAQKHFEQALMEYRVAEKNSAEVRGILDRDLKLRISKCLEGLGQFEEARSLLSTLLEKDPNDGDALNCLGVVLWKMDHLPEAIFVLERALRLDPSYPQARNNLGIALYQMKRSREAIDVWSQAIKLRPDYPEAHYNMGVALLEAGLFSQSVEAFKESLKYAPNDANAHNNLGLALAGLGQLQLDPTLTFSQVNLEKLAHPANLKPLSPQ